MTETPREYKKRIDEKWQKNAKNREKLIQKIESYELLDEGFKSKTKQEILENFQKNQKADQESEQYITITSELNKIDQKYEELLQIKEELKEKKNEKAKIEKKIRESKLDGADETTLKIQISEMRKLKEKLKETNSHIEECEKDIKNRKQELKEIEKTYGKKADIKIGNSLDSSEDEKSSYENTIPTNNKSTEEKPRTLIEFHKQTIQELWNKDRTRGEIFKILDKGTGIDKELKEKIKKKISDKFFEYYHEKQGSLRMKSARYLKNKSAKKLRELSKKLANKVTEIKEICEIGGKPVSKGKTNNGKLFIMRGDEKCGDYYDEIGDIKEIGGKPAFKVEKDGIQYYMLGKEKNETIGILEPFRKKWKEKITYKKDDNGEMQKKYTDAMDKIYVNIKNENGNKIIEFKLGDEIYKFLVVEDIEKYSDLDYLYEGINGDEVKESGIIGSKPEDWKNKKLAKFIKEQEKKGYKIPTENCIKEITKKLGKIIGNKTKNTNTQISHLMYLIGLEGNYRLDEYQAKYASRIWIGMDFVYDNRNYYYNSGKYERAKIFMIKTK